MIAGPETRVQPVDWQSHVLWLRQNLLPGQHVSIINPTGGGKSYLAVEGLLKLPVVEHSKVLFIDDKGRDQTTRGYGVPITEYPPTLRTRLRYRDHLPHYRLVVPEWSWSVTGSHDQGVKLARRVVGAALNRFYEEAEDPNDESSSENAQPSIVVIDETYALTALRPPSLNLGPLLIRNWRKGRYKALTQIALSQEPLWMPSEFYSQPTHLYLGRILDKRQQDRLREIGGNTSVIAETVAHLGQYEWLFIGDKGRVMSIVRVGR